VPEPIRVLCIAGTGQNGATLLCRALGEIPGFVPVGELGHLWDKGMIDDRECGCGAPFHACPFWTRVGEEGFGGWDNIDPVHVTALRGKLLLRRTRLPHPFALPLILRPGLSKAYGRALREYGDDLVRLYGGILRASGARIVVDSMKVPAHVYAVSQRPDLDVHVVHLVRDSRGVANSNVKVVKRQGEGMRVRRSSTKAALRWLWINGAFEALARRGVPTTVVRYESFVRSPRQELERIARDLGTPVDEGDLAFVSGSELELVQDHLVAGNRTRFERGRIVLKADEGWRTGLTARQRRSVTLLTRPLLRRYGYETSDPGA
jgi:hypothetical protein